MLVSELWEVNVADEERLRTRLPGEHADAYREYRADGLSSLPTATVKRMSWAAVFAGVVVALVVQLLLSLLGIGIGASTVNPVEEQNPVSGLGTGAGIWFGVSSLISLFAGGWVAGRMAGIPRRVDSLLHGVLTWSVATLLLFYFLTSTVGSIIGGTFRVLGSGLSAVASGVSAAAPEIADAAGDALERRGIDLDVSAIRREIETLLRQTKTPELQPGAIRSEVEQGIEQTQTAAARAAADPANSDEALSALLARLGRSGETMMNAADRDALVNIVMARTGQSRTQTEQTVASYERTYQDLRAKYEQTTAEAAQQARAAAGQAADAVTTAALSGFFALLLSAIAAAVGGLLATPRDVPARMAATPL